MSINGNGFFIIRDQETGEQLFSKMGNFYLSLSDNLYYLVDPYGNSVQGWNTDINGNISGSITDIVFSTESEPMESGKISVIANLDKDVESQSQILSSEWNGAATPPISSSAYEYESTINVYDIDGLSHAITIYYDKISNAEWEYIITCNPTEDLRAGIEGTEAAGLLARGIISFNEGIGSITGITMSRHTGSGDWTELTSNDFNQDGYFEFVADFLGGTATRQVIALDMGVRWNGYSFVPDPLSTTQYANASTTIYISSDGNGIEALAGLTVNGNGLITGHYISESDIPLFMVSIARFTAPDKLQEEGNFIYSETQDSGPATISAPGANGTGSIVQGGIEDDPAFTDELFPQIGINGEGFFIVKHPDNDNFYFTRSGEFYFNRDGYLTTPEGYIVQGWAIDPGGNISGSLFDIVKRVFIQPRPTNKTTFITNLDSDQESNSTILSSAWDGTSYAPVSPVAYGYQTTVKTYDSLGSTHDITVYYDKVSNAEWEYLVTCNPAEDMRAGIEGTKAAGLLATGTISFNEVSGTITGITMSRLTGYDDWSILTSNDFNQDGYFEFVADFLGGTATTQEISLDMGIRWNGSSFVTDPLSTTQYASAATTVYQSANGYSPGVFVSETVDESGNIYFLYSNSITRKEWQIAIATFPNPHGLIGYEGNIYRETSRSGPPVTGLPCIDEVNCITVTE
ncbi:MAG: flagellar hook-basal body complex protein [Deltaproteobacteria bacterium]|nr:flagellar hook-basal body complex protein [Deltaproteobacteria bacterium]